MIKRILLAFALAFASIGPTTTVPAAPAPASTYAIAALAAPAATNAIATLAAPVANINLANAITALTRTSSSGVTPMTWSIALAANVHEGDYLHIFVYSDGTLSTLTQSVRHRLTNADLQTGATLNLAADGLTAPTATQYLKAAIETTSPLGLGYSYTFATAISPTDAVTAMAWSATDKEAGITLSNGNLTASHGGGFGDVRATRAVGYDLTYWEVASVSGAEGVAVADTSAVLTQYWAPAFAGGTQTTHAAMYQGNDGAIYYDASATTVAAFGAGDNIDVALDRVNKKVWFRKNNGSWLPSGNPAAGTGGQAMASIGAIFPALEVGGGHSLTANFGTTPGVTTGFTRTPPAGFVAP